MKHLRNPNYKAYRRLFGGTRSADAINVGVNVIDVDVYTVGVNGDTRNSIYANTINVDDDNMGGTEGKSMSVYPVFNWEGSLHD